MFGRYLSSITLLLLSQVPTLGADFVSGQDEPASGEYLMFGKSMIDFSSGTNAYMSGGVPISHSVNIKFEENGKVSMDGLLGTRNSYVPISGEYEAGERRLNFTTPLKEVSSLSHYIHLADSEEGETLLCALNPYGLGYVELIDNLSFSFSDDYRSLYPASGFGAGVAYLITPGLYMIGSYDMAIYDAILLKKEEGISFNFDCRNTDIPNTFPGITTATSFRIYNTGDERSEYVVGSSSPDFIISNPAGVLKPGEFVDIQVYFTAGTPGEYSSVITVTNEEEDMVFEINATCNPLPDYSAIVSKGTFDFSTDPRYPWTISDEFGNGPVAVCGNRGMEKTTSPLYADVTISEHHAGNLSWEGYCDPYHPLRDAFGVIVDGKEFYVSPANGGSTTSAVEIAPGNHKIEFLYVKGPKVEGSIATGNDYAWIRNLRLVETQLEQNAFSVDVNKIIFDPKTIVKKGATDAVEVFVKNEGWDDLVILGAESDNDAFSAETPSEPIGTFDTEAVRILFHTFVPGKHYGNITIHTNVGDAVIQCSGEAVPVPDYSPIVTEGEFDFDTTIAYPFKVENNVAFNSTSKKVDRKATVSMLQANFEVPEGYVGELTWNARVSTSGSDNEDTTDYATIYIDGDDLTRDYSAETISNQYDFAPASVNFYPGSHFICFSYTQVGDGKYQGDDRIEISALSLELKQMAEDEVRFWGNDEAIFEDVRISKVYQREVVLTNSGSHNLQIKSANIEGDFSAEIDPERYYNSFEEIPVTITFIPKTPGIHEGAIILDTTAGEIRINCHASVINDPKTLLIEDFEDDWRLWDFADGDGDGMTWSNVMVPQNAFHGEHALQSFSIHSDFTEEPIDDIAFSPEVTVPEDGATLEFYLACYFPAAEDGIQILAGTGTDIDNYEPVAEFDLKDTPSYYNLYKCQLNDFAGQTIRIAFRHALDKGVMSFVAVDDILVTRNGDSGVDTINKEGLGILKVEYYNTQGIKVLNPGPGLYVRRRVYADGTETIDKINRK